MTQVDFHIINSPQQSAFLTYVCKLIRKAYKNGLKVYIRADNEQQMNLLDTLLWTFSDIDFIPHSQQSTGNENNNEMEQEPVIIGMMALEGDSGSVLINLNKQLTENYSSYSRVFELIANEPAAISAGRERYRSYKNMNDTLSNHQIAVN